MLESLFDNVGKKIKNLAIWVFALEAIGSIIAGFILAIETEEPALFFTAIVGVLLALVSAWLLYGLGELIDNSAAAKESAEESKRILVSISNTISRMSPSQAHAPQAPAKPAAPAAAKPVAPAAPAAKPTIPAPAQPQPVADKPKLVKPENLQPGEKWCPHCGKVYKSMFCGCGASDGK